MQVLYERCCGLDVHKKTVVACVLITSPDGQVHKQVRTIATTTAGLLALADWLAALQISHVALESTGIYWRPVFNLLEEGHTIILVNAQHMRAVPGRKTDSKDAEWIADLLRHGLRHRPVSFPPSPPVIYGIWCAIAKHWCKNGRKRSIACDIRAGNGQYQVILGGKFCVGQEWAADAGGDDRGGERC
jgi:Transposase